jgi:hypothetical protein
MSKLDLNGFFIISVEKRFGGLMSDQIRSNWGKKGIGLG